ncbi:MAG: hypothetical protein DRH33_09290 [Candidatus Nealsonbacteria bacterium]|nr:MAG: hypothetical protein DRH33_09290 [Candidatus Nealsonbacteria bacterium]
MHISEGILSAPVLVTGVALTATAVGYSLKKMEHKEVPKVAILSSVGHWWRASSKERIAPWKVGCVSRMNWLLRTAGLIQYHRVLFPVPE